MTTRLLAAAIAAQLPGAWHLLPGEDSWHGTLKRDDGIQFWIRDERGGRISAHKDAPAKCDAQWYRCEMSSYGLPDCDMVTMSADRAPEALAREIARRFLPNLEAYALAVLDRWEAYQADTVKATDSAKRLIDAGCTVSDNHAVSDNKNVWGNVPSGGPRLDGMIRHYAPDKVYIERLTVSVEQFLAIREVLSQ